MKIAIETISKDEKYADKMKHWKQVIEKKWGEFIQTGCIIEMTERRRVKANE